MIDQLAVEIKQIITNQICTPEIAEKFLQRVNEGKITRDENLNSHFCVFFAGFDPVAKKVFLGHHKKSGFWLFNGGHIDKGEIPQDTLVREMGEEWGIKVDLKRIGKPKLLTTTTIVNPAIKCRKHFDIWYFVPLSIKDFKPDQLLLDKEFYTADWKSIVEATALTSDQATLEGLSRFEDIFNNK